MKIQGIEGLSPERIQNEVERGGRFVIYSYCFSVLIMTFRRSTDIYFICPGESALGKGMPWTLLTLVVGWWGIPWGLIYTPMALIQNLGGGKDVTPQIMAQYQQPSQPASLPPQT